jgi:hypothetical protein
MAMLGAAPIVPYAALGIFLAPQTVYALVVLCRRQQWPTQAAAILTIFIAAWYVWNYFFNGFVTQQHLNIGVFRDSFRTAWAPLYGTYSFTQLSHQQTISLLAYFVCLCLFIWSRYRGSSVLLLSIIAACGLSALHLQAQLSAPQYHFFTFAEDLHLFNSWQQILATYNSHMASMQVHNAHYPPLNLIIMWCSAQWHFPLYAVANVLAAGISMYLLHKICVAKAHTTPQKNLVLFSTLFGYTILPLAQYGFEPLYICITLAIFYCTLIFINTHSFKHFIAAVICAAWLGMHTFLAVVILPGVACALYCIGHIPRPVRWYTLSLALALSIIAILYTGVYIATGFNILQCFAYAQHNNTQLMSDHLSGVLPQFLRSTGNLLAYALTAMPFIFGIHRHNTLLYLFVLALSFSGLFYFECDRIWSVFTPLFFLLAFNKRKNRWATPEYAILVLFIALQIVLKVFLTHAP